LVREYSGAVVARTMCPGGVCEMGHVGVAGVYCLDDGSTRWRSWLRHFATRWKIAGSLGFFIVLILPAALWPWDRLTSNRNEY